MFTAVEIKNVLMFIHVLHVLQVNMKRRSQLMLLELRQYSDLSRHITVPQICTYCLDFLKKKKKKLKACFTTRIPEMLGRFFKFE